MNRRDAISAMTGLTAGGVLQGHGVSGSAWAAESLPDVSDGVRFGMIGNEADPITYVRTASEPAHPLKIRSPDGTWWEGVSNLYSVKHFGAVGDGAADDTEAINAALNFIMSRRTSPFGHKGYGQSVLFFPKGRYRVTRGLSVSGSLVDIELRGTGPYSSAIEYHNDDDALIDCDIYVCVRFRQLGFLHNPRREDRSSWKNALFRGSGNGGGRMLSFDDCAVEGFDRVIDNTGKVNSDTFVALRTDFINFNTFYFARNSQAMCNTLLHCSLRGSGNLLDVAGGWWDVFNCNLLMDGSWLKLHGQQGLWGVSAGYKFVGCKGEPFNTARRESGSRSALVTLDGHRPSIVCQITFDQCMLTSDVVLDSSPDWPQIEVTSNMSVIFRGGGLKSAGSKIRLHATPLRMTSGFASRGLFFYDLVDAPSPRSISRVAGEPASTFPQVVYEGCHGLPNLCIGSQPHSSLGFKAGVSPFTEGARLLGRTSGAVARVKGVVLNGGEGRLDVIDVVGVFQDGEPIVDESGGAAVLVGLGVVVLDGSSCPSALDRAEQLNTLGSKGSIYSNLTFGPPKVHALDFFGSAQDIEDIVITVSDATGGPLLVETSLDGFATVLDGFQVPAGNNAYRPPVRASDHAVGTMQHDWPELATGAQQSTTLVVPGVRPGDAVFSVQMSAPLSGSRLWAEVTDNDMVTVHHRNDTDTPVRISGTLKVRVRRETTAVGRTSTQGVQMRISGEGPVYGYIHVKTRAR